MQPTRLCSAAATAAAFSPALVGFDPMTILTLITTLLPVFSNLFTTCFGPKPTPASVKEHLSAVYDGTSYDNGTLRVATRKAMVNSRQHGHKISQDQAQALAVATLDQLRTADDDVLQEAIDVHSA